MALIYCVEDDEGIRELISCALRSGGYAVSAFETPEEFQKAVRTQTPDLILLDIMLPMTDGLTVLRGLRANPATAAVPVIMVTAKSSELDKVSGLEEGADDYIAKPFGVMELLSRIKAVLRRAGKPEQAEEVLTVGEVSVDIPRHTVTCPSGEVVLTFKEFEMLAYLMRNKGIAVTREKLMRKVWGFSYEGETRTVDMHVKTLRQKLEQAGCENFITTVRGIGYKI
ncbi:MAG: response regulator transcription factor [Oscillospiraceae bacterium]